MGCCRTLLRVAVEEPVVLTAITQMSLDTHSLTVQLAVAVELLPNP